MFKDENGKFYYGWIIVLVAGLVTGFVYNGIASVTGIFMLPVTTDLGISVGGFSLYFTIMSFVSMFVLMFFSKYFTEKSIKKMMAIGGILTIISFVGFSFASSLWMFYAFAVLQGVGFATMTMTPCQVLVSNWFGEKLRGRAITVFLAILALMYTALANVLNTVIIKVGWRMGYIILAILTLVSLIIVLKFVVWSPDKKGIKRLGDLNDEELKNVNLATSGIDFKSAIKKPITWLAFISCGLAVIGSSSVLVHGIPTMQLAGMDSTTAIGILSALTIVMTFIGPVIGWISDRFGVPVVTIGTAVSFTVGIFGLALATTNLMLGVIVFFVGYLFGIACVNIVSPLLMGYMFGEKDLPKFLGYVNIFISLGAACGSGITGSLYEVFGSYRIPWLIVTGIIVIVTIIRIICSNKKHKFVPVMAENEN